MRSCSKKPYGLNLAKWFVSINITNDQLLEYYDYMTADLKRIEESIKKLETSIDEDQAQLAMTEADLVYYKDLLEKHRKEKPESPQCKTYTMQNVEIHSISATTFQIKHLPGKLKCTYDDGDEVLCWAGIGTISSLNKETGECRIQLKYPLGTGR